MLHGCRQEIKRKVAEKLEGSQWKPRGDQVVAGRKPRPPGNQAKAGGELEETATKPSGK